MMIVGNPGLGAAIRRPDSFTKLHLRMNGEGNIFRDLTGKSVTAYGNATQSRLNSYFLGSIAYLDGDGDYLEIPPNEDFNFGTGDFTFEGILYAKTDAEMTLFSRSYDGTTNADIIVRRNSGGNIDCFIRDTIGTIIGRITTGNATINTFNHIAYVRQGTLFTVFLNGISIGTSNASTALHINTVYQLNISINPEQSTGFINGYASELRISNVSRYTTNFTPSTRRK
jgi:hypothetical protein